LNLLPLLSGLAAVLLAVAGGRDLFRGEADVPSRSTRSRLKRLHREGNGSRGWSLSAPRLAGASAGVILGFLPSRLLPGRLGPLLLAGLVLGGMFLPDLIRLRTVRMRHRRMVGALPDALDLLAVSVAAGRGLPGSLADLAAAGRGPLVAELARTGEDMAWGSSQAAALDCLRRRVGGPEITSLVATLERSRRLGSPLADQLRRQSATLRQDQRRAIEEQAARAAPKIQMVIALALVPAVLLLMVAALIANADNLLPAGI